MLPVKCCFVWSNGFRVDLIDQPETSISVKAMFAYKSGKKSFDIV
jgi:hypothetical protein